MLDQWNTHMKFVDLNDARLAYEISGEGPPVIFVHGFLANATGPYYAAFKQELARSCTVYAVDMRGHGETVAETRSITLGACARDIVAFAEALNLQMLPLIGHSMGGYLSMAAARLAPDRFSALALLTPAGSQGQPNPDEVVADFMAARRDAALMHQRFGAMFTSPPDSAELDILRQAALRLPDEVAERWMREEWPNSNQTGQLPDINLPVLSLIGALDVVVPPTRQYDDALLMKDTKVVTFTREGHMLPLEKPVQCCREIMRFSMDLGLQSSEHV